MLKNILSYEVGSAIFQSMCLEFHSQTQGSVLAWGQGEDEGGDL